MYSLSAYGTNNDPFAFELDAKNIEKKPWYFNTFISSRNRAYVLDKSLSSRFRVQLEGVYEGDDWRFFGNGYTEYYASVRDYEKSPSSELNEAYFLLEIVFLR